MPKEEKMAIIDLGSNTIRLVIYTMNHKRRYRSFLNVKVAARLGELLDKEDFLLAEGFKILDDVMSEFCTLLRTHNVQEVRAVATAAVRRAKNREEILAHVYKKTDIHVNILSGHEEAYYGYLAGVNSMDLQNGLVFDMGGSSTEVAYFKERKLQHTYSFPIGALTLAKDWNEDQTSVRRMKKMIQKTFSSHPWFKNIGGPVIGIGGTARQFAAVHQRRIQYPLAGLHQYEMKVSEVDDTYQYLKKIPSHRRSDVSGLSKERAPYIVPAGFFIQELLKYTRARSFIISRKGLRDGLLYESLLSPSETDVFVNVKEETLFQLSQEFNLSESHGIELARIAKQLYFAFRGTGAPLDQKLLNYSARLRMFGSYIDEEQAAVHTFSVLTNRSLDGFNHSERLAVALIASYTSGKALRKNAAPYRRLLPGKLLRKYDFFGAVLRLAAGLFTTGRQVVDRIEAQNSAKGKTIFLYIYTKPGKSAYFEQQRATIDARQLERVTRREIRLLFHNERARAQPVIPPQKEERS